VVTCGVGRCLFLIGVEICIIYMVAVLCYVIAYEQEKNSVVSRSLSFGLSLSLISKFIG
jgi:hypothetical protein